MKGKEITGKVNNVRTFAFCTVNFVCERTGSENSKPIFTFKTDSDVTKKQMW